MAPQRSPERRCRRLSPRVGAATMNSTPAHASTESAVSLPNDLIFDILSRLPVKSMCRFRCVSREWCALISDATFVAAHKFRRTDAEALVCLAVRVREHKLYFELLLMDMDGSVIRVMEAIDTRQLLSTSMDDLVCVTNYPSGDARVIDPVRGEVLAHCPGKTLTTMGFGRAVSSGAYKVVRVCTQTCEVFTLEDDTRWRRSRSPPTIVSNFRGHPVVVNGVMYFLLWRGLNNDSLANDILPFDIEREEWRKTIPGPLIGTDTKLWNNSDLGCISEFNDTLCYVHSERSTKNRCVNICLLTDIDNNTWTKAYTIRVPHSTDHFMPLRMTDDGGKLKILRFVSNQGYELCVYDPRTETCMTLHKLDYGICEISLCRLQLDRFVLSSQPRSSSHSL